MRPEKAADGGQGSLYGAAGLALASGGILVALAEAFEPVTGVGKALLDQWAYYPAAWATLAGGVLIAFGWPGVYLHMRHRSGKLALGSMLVVWASAMLVTFGISLIRLLIFPWLTTLRISPATLEAGPPDLGNFFFLMWITASLGGIFFALSMLRSRVYSSWAVWGFLALVVVSVGLGFANLPGSLGNLGLMAYMLGLAWLGVELYGKSRLA